MASNDPAQAKTSGGAFDLSLYKKVTSLGRGNFGTVFKWKLMDEKNESERYPLWIAVKEVVPLEEEDLNKQEADMRKIEREHYILNRHPHENIVSYLGRIDDEELKQTNFIMELCTTDLKRFSSKRKLSDLDIAVIMKEVLLAMDHLHKNDVLHRDIKPGNILIKVNQQDFDLETVSLCNLTVKLCDFGLSRYMIRGCDATMTMSTVGSLAYLAPEVRRDHMQQKPTSRYMASFDTFSAGVVVHELSTGKLELNEKVFSDFTLLEESLGDNCDQNLLSLLKSMLDSDKRKRKTPSELLQHPFIKMGEHHLNIERKMMDYEERIRDKNISENKLTQKIQNLETEICTVTRKLDEQIELNAATENIKDNLLIENMELTRQLNKANDDLEEQKSVLSNTEQIKSVLTQENQKLKEQLEESNRARMASEEEICKQRARHESETRSLKQELESMKEQLINKTKPVAPTPVLRQQVPQSKNTGARSKNVATIQPRQQQQQQQQPATVTRSFEIPSSRPSSHRQRTNTASRPTNASPSQGRIWVERNLNKEEQKRVNDQVWVASRDGDIESIKTALQQGAQTNYFIGPYTSLHMAAKNGHLEATDLLLNEGADVNAGTERTQFTALMLASANNHPQVVKLLLEHGASVNMKDSVDGSSALHIAAIWANLSCVQLLVEVGKADVNVRDNEGRTPLARAEEREWGKKEDYDALIKYLKENGATK